jgi:hypothetical protein
VVRENARNGIFFRNESLGMAPHRNRLEENVIENNGEAEIRIRGHVNDLVFSDNTIRDESDDSPAGILIEEHVGPLRLRKNVIQTQTPIEDRRPSER